MKSFLPLLLLPLLTGTAIAAPSFEFRDGDKAVFLGDSFIEREQYAGWIELAATTQFPDRNVTFRNLGWSADTPAGDSRNGLSLVQAGREPAGEGWNQLLKQLSEYEPNVIVLGYGTAASLPGGSAPEDFRANLTRLLDEAPKATGKETRFLILGTSPREDNNRQAIEAILSETATKRNIPFVSMDELAKDPSHFQNPIHLTDDGYKAAARIIERSLGWQEKPWDKGNQAETLRQHIIRKNEWFLHRSRPANMAYIFGFRKREQGRNAGEIPQFDALIAEEDAAIAKMRDLSSGTIVPMKEVRTESAFAAKTPQELPKFTVADGFEVTLWAENPLFHKPTQMNFDPQGRLWVTSCLSYPQIEVGQTPNDKAIILEDTDGDGKADKSTVFAEGMLMPTGLLPADGGVYVAQSTDLLHFKDTDGDGKADVKTRVLSGFGTEDTHHNLHTLRRGPDGRIWMNQSIYTRSDVETPHGIVRLKSGGIFRFDTRKMELKPTYFGFWNAWGHEFDKYGQSFLTDGAGGTGINWGMPGATYEAFAGGKKALGGVSPGGDPKFCGLEIIESAHFPADWQGNMITCDFRAHRVVRFSITDEGAGYVTQRLGDLLHTDSANFRPIDVKLGPDGALYIADWANPIINHGEVDFRDPRRDREHGRIWRVAKKDSPPIAKKDFTKLPGTELVAALGSANRYDRDQATAVLYESASPGLQAALHSVSKADGIASLNASRILASRFGKSSNAPLAGIASSLASETPEIRAAAVRLLVDPNHAFKPDLFNAAFRKTIADPSPRVRLETIRALAESNLPNSLDIALDALKHPRDRFIDYALWLGVQSHGEEWLVYAHTQSGTVDAEKNQFVLANLPPEKGKNALDRVFPETLPKDGSGPWLQLGIKNGDAGIITKIFDQAVTGGFDETTTTAAFKGIATAISERQVKPTSDISGLAVFIRRVDPAAIELAGALADERLLPALLSITTRGAAITDETSEKIIVAVANFPSPLARDMLTTFAANADPSFQRQVALALTRHHREAALPLITSIAATLSDPQASRDFWQKALTASGISKQLAETLKAKPLPPEIAALTLQHIPEIAEHDALLALLRTQAGASATQTHDIPAMARSAAEKGDARRGELIYRRPALACTACHAIGGAGGKVGPDMTSIGASAPMDYLIESVVNPGAKIKEGYHSVIIQTKDGNPSPASSSAAPAARPSSATAPARKSPSPTR
jgi:glucose/arabinose dehydrogenase